jgi:hypothetical protein
MSSNITVIKIIIMVAGTCVNRTPSHDVRPQSHLEYVRHQDGEGIRKNPHQFWPVSNPGTFGMGAASYL